MNNYEVVISAMAFEDISSIADFIESISTKEHAMRYADHLEAEIRSLSYLADCMQYSRWPVALRCHPLAKRLITRNRKWNIIFHTVEGFVIVDRIVPSSMMK